MRILFFTLSPVLLVALRMRKMNKNMRADVDIH